MRIPVYSLIDGGWDRAIARRAFADSLPTEIVRRRAKGGSTRSAKLLFENNMPFIREFMLNGLLVRERILDRKKLETHLTPGRPVNSSAFGEILIEHLCTEAWLRSWNRPIEVASVA
jgi:asparagine synthase (glutamine-hydrolysing)